MPFRSRGGVSLLGVDRRWGPSGAGDGATRGRAGVAADARPSAPRVVGGRARSPPPASRLAPRAFEPISNARPRRPSPRRRRSSRRACGRWCEGSEARARRARKHKRSGREAGRPRVPPRLARSIDRFFTHCTKQDKIVYFKNNNSTYPIFAYFRQIRMINTTNTINNITIT